MEITSIVLMIVAFMTIFNTMFMFAIAASVSKLIKSIKGEPVNSKEVWSQIIQERKLAQMQEGNSPTYADHMAKQSSESVRNWDGLPHIEE